MSEVDISFATFADRADILRFIKDHWRENHVFVTSPQILDWQHDVADADPGDLSFVLARERLKGTLVGLLGYISYRRFDSEIEAPPIALALWRTIDTSVAGLGVRLLWFLERTLQPSMISVIGLNESVEQLYDALGYRVGVMDLWVLFSPLSQHELRIAKHVPSSALERQPVSRSHGAHLHDSASVPMNEIALFLDLTAHTHLPEKSIRYIQGRYIEHPFYDYQFLCVYELDTLLAVLVGRFVEHDGARVLRVVDFLGPTHILGRTADAIQEILDKKGIEYLELLFLCDFADELSGSGFVRASDHPEMVIPAYFEPFEARNISIAFAFKCENAADAARVRLCRADSDQDRPNQAVRRISQ